MATRYGTNNADEFVLPEDSFNGTADETYGYGGDDVFYAPAGHGLDFVYGGEGVDTLSLDYSANSYNGVQAGLSLSASGAGAIYGQWGTYDRLYLWDIEKFVLKGTNADDAISTDNGNYDDIFYGLSGNDYASVNGGNNLLDGGLGNDTLMSASGNDTIIGGDGNDDIRAHGEVGQGGFDQIDGGAGIDRLRSTADFSTATTSLRFTDTGATQTTVSLANGIRVAGIEYLDRVTTGSGNDVITYTSSNDQVIKTGAGNDTITAGVGNDYVDGGVGGSDLLKVDFSRVSYDAGIGRYAGGLFAKRSNEQIIEGVNYTNIERLDIKATNVADTLYGGNFADTLSGNGGNDWIQANGGNDTVNGGSGSDSITGGLGNDSLSGSSENDTLIGGAGNDTLVGGTGADRFGFVAPGGFADLGVDTITDFVSGTDKIALSTYLAFSNLPTGTLTDQTFAKVASDTEAANSSALITYNTTTGALFYNQNGASAGFGTGAQFATLSNKPNLAATDIEVLYFYNT